MASLAIIAVGITGAVPPKAAKPLLPVVFAARVGAMSAALPGTKLDLGS